MLVPGLAFAVSSAYVVLSPPGGCTFAATRATAAPATGGCAANAAGVAAVTFPLAVICILVAAGVLRGSRWARWPAVGLGAVLATVTAAAALAGVVALGGDGAEVKGAVILGVVGVAIAAACALPAILLAGERGAAVFPPAKT